MITIQHKAHFGQGRRGKRELRTGNNASPDYGGPLPRLTKLMALAIRFDQMIRDGVVADQAELARLGHVSRARVTQIMNLLNLAPNIQEEILSLPRVQLSPNIIVERDLRLIAIQPNWQHQRIAWRKLLACKQIHSSVGSSH